MIYLILFQIALFVLMCVAVLLGRWFQMAIFHFISCMLCLVWMIPSIQHMPEFVLFVLCTFPFGWLIPFFRLGDLISMTVALLINSLAWAVTVEWLLRRFVDPPKDSRVP